MKRLFILSLLAAALFLSGCDQQSGTLGGGALGAASGMAIGSAIGDDGTGTLIGGVLGGLGGAALGSHIGDDMEKKEEEAQYQQRRAQSAARSESVNYNADQDAYRVSRQREAAIRDLERQIEKERLEMELEELRRKRYGGKS